MRRTYHALLTFTCSVAFVVPSSAASIRGRVTLASPAPANPVIRMGADPVCAALARGTGKLPVQQFVVTDGKGGLANVFLSLQGVFPATKPSTAPVTISQQTCVYEPRVVGAQVGQTLAIANLDATLHNLHSLSPQNPFNVSQPRSGMVFNIVLKAADAMMRLKCDVHSWMVGYVGVVSHPYFAVSASDGSYVIGNAPPGRYTMKTWHERFGEQTTTVTVVPSRDTVLDLAYDPAAKPRFEQRVASLDVP